MKNGKTENSSQMKAVFSVGATLASLIIAVAGLFIVLHNDTQDRVSRVDKRIMEEIKDQNEKLEEIKEKLEEKLVHMDNKITGLEKDMEHNNKEIERLEEKPRECNSTSGNGSNR